MGEGVLGWVCNCVQDSLVIGFQSIYQLTTTYSIPPSLIQIRRKELFVNYMQKKGVLMSKKLTRRKARVQWVVGEPTGGRGDSVYSPANEGC